LVAVVNAWQIGLAPLIECGAVSIVQNNPVTRLPRNVVQAIKLFRCPRQKPSKTLLRMIEGAAGGRDLDR
jgi:hypothetical protein